jgi:cell division protease FtsH
VSDTKVTFVDVAGVDEAKEELQEIVGFLSRTRRATAGTGAACGGWIGDGAAGR